MEKQPLKPSKNERIKKNKFALSNSVSGTINGTNSGINEWKARFVHDGSWIVGSYDWEPNGPSEDIAEGEENNYERHKGAFGACTGASCPTP